MTTATNYVTGANGFIGKKLIQRLGSSAISVPHKSISTRSGAYLPCEAFFFLSAYGNMAGQDISGMAIKANVLDVLSVLENCYDIRSFVYTSSSSVTLPVQTPYSRTKRAAEEIIQSLPPYGPARCIVRPYSVTGVGEQPNHLIPTLIRSCLSGEPMQFEPTATHDFVDVSDVVDGLINLANNKAVGIFEFGCGIPTSNEEVLEMVEVATGKKANITTVSRIRDYDTEDWYCRNPSGFTARKPLSLSIIEMVEAYGSK